MKNYYEEEARSEWSTYLQQLEEEKKREKRELQQRRGRDRRRSLNYNHQIHIGVG